MYVSKTGIALYGVLAAGVIAGLYFEISVWLLIGFAGLIGIIDSRLDRRVQSAPPQIVRPWRRAGFWIVLAAIGACGAGLVALGATIATIAVTCGFLLALYAYDVARQIELLGQEREGTRGLGPSVEDWALLSTSLAFCTLGLLLLMRDWRTAVVTITFFGSCALIFWTNILRKRRERHWQNATVQVAGGVDIHAKGAHMPAIAFGCMLVGSVCFFVGTNYPLFLRLLGAFIAFVGIGVAIATALGHYRRQFLRFDPDAITFGERTYRYRVDWDNIEEVLSIEYADNPFLGIRLCDAERVEVDPVQQTEIFRTHLTNNRSLMNVDIFIAARNFGIDATILRAALTRYATDPHARRELERRRTLAITFGSS